MTDSFKNQFVQACSSCLDSVRINNMLGLLSDDQKNTLVSHEYNGELSTLTKATSLEIAIKKNNAHAVLSTLLYCAKDIQSLSTIPFQFATPSIWQSLFSKCVQNMKIIELEISLLRDTEKELQETIEEKKSKEKSLAHLKMEIEAYQKKSDFKYESDIEKQMTAFTRKIEKVKRKREQNQNELKKEVARREEKEMECERYKPVLECLLFVGSIRNDQGFSAFHCEELIPVSTELLDMCQKYLITDGNTFSRMFPCFSGSYEKNTQSKNGNAITSTNPLVVLGEAGHLPLIKHPYVQTYVDVSWSSGASQWFYLNLTLLSFFLFFLTSFFTSHKFQLRDEGIEFESRIPIFTEISRYFTIGIAIAELAMETMQMYASKKKYWKQPENVIDLFLFTTAPGVMIISLDLLLGYNAHVHWSVSMLITITGIRTAWELKYLPYLGNYFRMLFSVLNQVCRFSPILLFFVLLFSVTFHGLLQNQDSFHHIGFSIMKVLTMTIGELEFTAMFFDEINADALEIVAFLLFFICIFIMTISMINLLIGLAIPDVGKLNIQGKQSAFRSKVDLIVQFNNLFHKHVQSKHQKEIHEIKGESLGQYLKNLEEKYNLYKISKKEDIQQDLKEHKQKDKQIMINKDCQTNFKNVTDEKIKMLVDKECQTNQYMIDNVCQTNEKELDYERATNEITKL